MFERLAGRHGKVDRARPTLQPPNSCGDGARRGMGSDVYDERTMNSLQAGVKT
jgi:hypothetical protein